jgi:hypothetical protein
VDVLLRARSTMRRSRFMKLWGNVAGVIAVVIGAIWILQGANILGGSIMSGQSQWLYIGAVVVIAGVIGLWWVNFR